MHRTPSSDGTAPLRLASKPEASTHAVALAALRRHGAQLGLGPETSDRLAAHTFDAFRRAERDAALVELQLRNQRAEEGRR